MKPSAITSEPSTMRTRTAGSHRSASAPLLAAAVGLALLCSSGTRKRIGRTSSAGAIAIRNIARQPQAGTT